MQLTQIHSDTIVPLIYWIRGQKVILDRDIAQLYGVKTKVLKQAVRRNRDRFPQDFMFILSKEEFSNWRSQNVTSNSDRMGLRYPPMAFSEQGVAMLSSVLKSKQAIQVNITIMRTFVELRTLVDHSKELAEKMNLLEDKYDKQFKIVFETIKMMLSENKLNRKPRRQAGFHV
ncbi:MAG: ORF6N domain-containing protein [Puniceicoccaceae bacterium]